MASTVGLAMVIPCSASVPLERSKPMAAHSRVDLPAPLGPITVTISPSCTLSSTPCTACTSP